MHIERIHKMIECLTEKTLSELDRGIENVNVEEMSEAVDMIKDLCEAEYRAFIVKSMKKADEEEEEYNKELLRTLKAEYDEEGGRRFYDNYRYADGRFAPKGHGTRRGYSEPYYHQMPNDYHEWANMDASERRRDLDRMQGRMYYTETMPSMAANSESNYDKAKRHYTESKEMHKANTPADKEQKMKDLESYFKELSDDIMGLMNDMSAEERTMLKAKISALATKI